MSSKTPPNLHFDVHIRHRIGERDLTLDIASNAMITALVGPSGIGKTTMLNCIAGLMTPDDGQISVDGALLFDSKSGVDLAPEQRGAGYVFQDMRLFPHMKVGKNLTYGAHQARGPNSPNGREIADILGLEGLLNRWPESLSGGEKRRVAIGRALLSCPRFLLLDEPVASLDQARAQDVETLIKRISDTLGLPILIVSHDMAQVERLAAHVTQMGDTGAD